METERNYVINPTCAVLDERAVAELAEMIDSVPKSTALVFDLNGIESCVNKFFVLLRRLSDYRISLVNVESRFLTTLYLMGFDKYVKIYNDEVSLNEKKNELIKRDFKLLCRNN
jgi:hypothetical protein